jgi:5'-deoxynucleotidase
MAHHFFAYLSRMRLIRRWGLMHNIYTENIQEHSLQVAMIAHCLAVVGNQWFGRSVNPDRVALLAIYHEVSEVITGDLATPIKYFNPKINSAYKELESIANEKLLSMLPSQMRDTYRALLFPGDADREAETLVKAADRLCAWLKCVEELKAGNREFEKAERSVYARLMEMGLPEVEYFIEEFAPGYSLTLDELN